MGLPVDSPAHARPVPRPRRPRSRARRLRRGADGLAPSRDHPGDGPDRADERLRRRRRRRWRRGRGRRQRQGAVRIQRLQLVPHVQARGLEREDRPRPRQPRQVREAGEAAARALHARVDREPEGLRAAGLPAGDAELRLAAQGPGRRARRVPDEEELRLPPDFPRDVEAFACDLDRTLIGEDVTLRPRTRLALRSLREAGIHVVLVTGRMFRSVRPYALIAALDEEGFGLNCYVDDELYVAEVTPAARRYADFQHLELHPVGDLLAWLDAPPTKLVVIDDPHVLDELELRLKARFDGRLYISKSLPYFLELASPDVTKASGLEFLARRVGFACERTVACGDGENDVEMLEWAGYAVAVANAHELVLAQADLVCPSVDEEW